MLARFTAFWGKKPSNKSGNIRKTNCDPVIHFTFPDQILPILAIATVAPENAPETKGIPQRLSNLWKVWLTCFCTRKKKQRPTMYQSMSATHCLDYAHGPVISSLVVLIEQTRFPVVLQTSPLVFYILWMQTHSLHGLRCPVRTIVRVLRIKTSQHTKTPDGNGENHSHTRQERFWELFLAVITFLWSLSFVVLLFFVRVGSFMGHSPFFWKAKA